MKILAGVKKVPGGLMVVPLMLGALADFYVVKWVPLIIAMVVFSLLAAFLLTRSGKGIRKVWVVRLMLALLFMMFSAGIILETNFLLDRSEPTAERLAISDMHVSSGRSTSYELEFETGGETLSLDVEPQLYDRVQPGDTVYVVTNHGAFGIEYATVWTVDEWNYRY